MDKSSLIKAMLSKLSDISAICQDLSSKDQNNGWNKMRMDISVMESEVKQRAKSLGVVGNVGSTGYSDYDFNGLKKSPYDDMAK